MAENLQQRVAMVAGSGDSSRLDWLEANPGRVSWAVGYRSSPGAWVAKIGVDVVEMPSLRAAIDAAQERE